MAPLARTKTTHRVIREVMGLPLSSFDQKLPSSAEEGKAEAAKREPDRAKHK
jgi:hypothetical protein